MEAARIGVGLVGRDAELKRLDRLIGRAREPRGGALLVEGSQGWARARGWARSTAGTCYAVVSNVRMRPNGFSQLHDGGRPS